METENNNKVIPQVQKTKTFADFFKQSMNLIKTISPEIFNEKVQQLGIQSRVSYRQILMGKRKFPQTKIPHLAAALDLSFVESTAAANLNSNRINELSKHSTEYIVGFAETLSNPLHTIVLNLCGLSKKMNLADLKAALKNVFSEIEVEGSVELLIKHELISFDAEYNIIRTLLKHQMSTVPGVKVASSKMYIEKSLELAAKNYELPLESREYTAFTARIKKEDFLKVKDLVRDFRKSIYELSATEDSDAVTHVNVNAFLIEPQAESLF